MQLKPETGIINWIIHEQCEVMQNPEILVDFVSYLYQHF